MNKTKKNNSHKSSITKKYTGKNISRNHKNQPVIIHIDGIPGSGKTYICSQITIPDSVCIDNDDIVLYAKNYVDSLIGTKDEMPRTFNSVNKIIKKKVDELIKEHTRNGKKIIIFVGVRFLVDTRLNDANLRYFIKLNDLGTTFRRVFTRETEKIVDKSNEIKKIINNPKIEEIELDDMVYRITNLALPYPPEFLEYKKHYKRALGIAKKNNYKVLTQDEIIKYINKL